MVPREHLQRAAVHVELVHVVLREVADAQAPVRVPVTISQFLGFFAVFFNENTQKSVKMAPK